MSDAAQIESASPLYVTYQRLELLEEEVTRSIELAKQNLEGVRELKKRIGEKIFQQQPTDSLPTTDNGNQNNRSTRS